MTFRDKLLGDIKAHLKESKWEQMLHDQLVELLEMKPQSPYDYIHKKISLRSKLDNTKTSSFLTELLIYCLYVNPLQISQTQIQNKILYLCVEKYQHSKIRKNQAINIINGLLQLANCQQKQKEYFLKLISQQIQGQTLNVCYFAQLMHSAVLFIGMKKQIDELDQKLQSVNQHINWQILHDYLEAVNPQVSIMKNKQIKVESDGDIYKIIAIAVLDSRYNK